VSWCWCSVGGVIVHRTVGGRISDDPWYPASRQRRLRLCCYQWRRISQWRRTAWCRMLVTCTSLNAFFIMRPSYRPHYAYCPSVCPSVRPVRARNSKTTKRRKIKIGIHVPHGTSKWIANFQFERSEVKVTVHKNLQNLASCLLTGGSAGGSSADCTL